MAPFRHELLENGRATGDVVLQLKFFLDDSLSAENQLFVLKLLCDNCNCQLHAMPWLAELPMPMNMSVAWAIKCLLLQLHECIACCPYYCQSMLLIFGWLYFSDVGTGRMTLMFRPSSK